MDKWQNAVVTSAGISMLGQVISGGKLNITRAALGSGTVDASALMAQKALTLPLDVSVVIAKMELIDGSGISIRLQIRNTGVTATRTMKQIGLFAKVGDGEEALFAIMQDDGGEEIPSESSYPDFMLEFTAAVAVSNTDGITVTVSGSAAVTLEELEERLKSYATSEELGDKADKSEIPTSLPANGGNAAQLGGISASELDRVRHAVVGGAGGNGNAQWTGVDATKGDTTIRMQVDADYDKILLFKSIDGQKNWTEIELNADTLDGKHAEDFKILTFVDNDADVTCIEARRDNTIIRLRIQTNMEIARLFKSTDGGASWTGLPLGDAASVGGAPLTTNASTIGLHQISSGSAAATTANCPVGTWYGKHS